jgi:hypothetical protein
MKSREKILLLGFCFLSLSAFAAKAQVGIVDRNAGSKPTLVILGTYHMGTPGNNVVNPKVNDVSAPERQRQIVDLVGRLKKFKPTKIVVECDLEDDAKIQERFDKYLAGSYQLSKTRLTR